MLNGVLITIEFVGFRSKSREYKMRQQKKTVEKSESREKNEVDRELNFKDCPTNNRLFFAKRNFRSKLRNTIIFSVEQYIEEASSAYDDKNL